MSNATMTMEQGLNQEPKQEQDQPQEAGTRRPAQQVRYEDGGCRIDGHQGYGCTCTQMPARR